MNVVFRVDASLAAGSGHVMRCLTLADALRQQGAATLFLCREHPGSLIGLIGGRGHRVVYLRPPGTGCLAAPEDVAHAAWLGVSWREDAEETSAALGQARPEWLIVDHYALDRRWEQVLRPRADKLMVIDDLADRPHDCDLLLDQNLYPDLELRYDGLVPEHCRKFLGPAFALLRPEFAAAHHARRERDGSVQRILIFFGGSDPSQETGKALEALGLLNRPDIAVDIVVGGANPRREEIRALCAALPNLTYHCQVANMAQLMGAADLAVGAGGSTAWERCLLGLPSITLVIAENQAQTTAAVAARGATWDLGWCGDLAADDLKKAVQFALDHPHQLKEMGRRATEIMAGSGYSGTHPLLAVILEENHATA